MLFVAVVSLNKLYVFIFDTAPNKVTDLSAESTTDTIKLTWKAPSGDKTGYKVTCDPPDSSKSAVSIDDGKTTQAEFKGLTAGKEYKLAVRAVCGDLESDGVELKTNASK